jgi:protein involved in polysaccharide export with SLBB domain
VKLFSPVTLFIVCALLTGCGGMSQAPTASAPGPAPAETAFTDVMRAGDKITVRLSGVPDDGYIIEVQVPDSGDITVPLLTRTFHVVGRNASDVAGEISEAYKTAQIYSNPNVTIIPEERFVNIGGDVRSPARVLYTPDLTLLSAINSCGGFTDYANRHTVRILRGKQVIYVDAITASRTPGADPALVPGDQVTVPRTMF